MVIAIHSADPFNVSPEARANPEFNYWGSIYGSMLRACVPLFVMITGLLLLPVKMTMKEFYTKRLMRILIPFLIWSVLYNLFPWVTGLLGISAWNSFGTLYYFAGFNGYLLLVPISLKIPVTSVIAFVISWALVAVVYRWAPRVARVVFG